MRILFTSTPLEGHINPLWRYAEALRGAGHEVRFAASEKARASVEKRGFALTPVADPSEEESKRVWAMLDACSADEALAIGIREFFGGIMSHAALPAVRTAVADWSPDLVVRESMELAGLIAAEEADVLRSAILRALEEEGMRRKADELAQEMAAMTPMAHAVDLIETFSR